MYFLYYKSKYMCLLVSSSRRKKAEEMALYQSIKEARLAQEKLDAEKHKQEEEEKRRLQEVTVSSRDIKWKMLNILVWLTMNEFGNYE